MQVLMWLPYEYQLQRVFVFFVRLFRMIAIQVTIVSLGCVCSVFSYNILGLFPFPAKSHYATIDPLMMKLAEIGHKVTVYSPFPKKQGYANYKEVDTSKCFQIEHVFNMSIDSMKEMCKNSILATLSFTMFVPTVKMVDECTPLIKLLNSTDKYDLLITESFTSDVMLMFANKFQIPFITYIPNVMLAWLYDRTANPVNPSYIPNIIAGHLSRMNFLERVENTLLYLLASSMYKMVIMRKEDQIIKHYLGASASSLSVTVKNTSLIFLNSHFSVHPPIPIVPQVVAVGGIQIKPARKLPQDIEKFLNDSTDGVIYFCMGSLLRGETFPEVKRNAFLKAFLKIPQRILWKWEGDVLPGKSDKIMISKWMPQRDILANPKVKLFISHGGLLGTSEAVYEGVPVLGIPIFGDQRTNVKSLEANGAGELLDYNDISEEVVLEKIQRLVNDPKYKQNARELSARYKDRPMSPLDTAVYWTEYVIRHKGAHHLKTAAVDMSWYQYLLVDVIAFFIFVLVTVVVVLYYSAKYSFRFIFNLLRSKKSTPGKVKKEKHN